MNISRRSLLMSGLAATGSVALGAPAVFGQAKPRVVVIGGGAGGATAARYIAKDSNGAIAVTLVEENEVYQTCFHSNLYVGGFKSFDDITHRYDALTKNHGITLARARATQIDRDKKEVVLSTGDRLPYDRLVPLARHRPEIQFGSRLVEGGGGSHAPWLEAWAPDPADREKLDAVPDGGLIVMIAPPNPYRCPPRPCQRASMFAHALKKAGKKSARIMILDPKDSFSKQGTFQAAWEQHYGTMIEWLGPKIHDGIKSVDPKTGTVISRLQDLQERGLRQRDPGSDGWRDRARRGPGTGRWLLRDRCRLHALGRGPEHLRSR